MPPDITTRIHRANRAQFPDLRARWDACLAACPPEQGLFSCDWYRAWVAAYTAVPPWTGNSCVIEAIDAVGAPCAFLPLAERRQQGLTFLSLAGFYQPLRTFPCVPAQAGSACGAIAGTLNGPDVDWDVLRLGPVDNATPERTALIAALHDRFPHHVRIPRGCTIVNHLLDSMDAYNTQKSVKRIRSYERRFLRESGADITHIRNPGGEAARAVFCELGIVERNSWLATQNSDLRFAEARDQAYWSDVCNTSLAPRQQLDVWLAHRGTTPVAFRVVLSAGEASYMIANQYDESAAEFRLGWILYLRNIETAMERHTRFIDSAPGDIHYKGRLGGEEAQMRFDLCFMPKSPKGAALSAALRTLHRTREALESRAWGKPLAARLPRV